MIGDTFWGDLPAYVIGPLLGGAAAALAFDQVARLRVYELELAQGTHGAVEGRRDAPGEPPAVTHAGSGRETSGAASLNTTQREERYG
jgi:hypothetical protein